MIPENPSRGSSDATSRLAGMPPEMVGGRYRVEQTVGVGGMATVYRATDLKHQRNVALKILSAALYDSTGAQRFLREITIAANLTHPHILPLHDSGEVDGLLYYVMPFVDGPTLRAKLRTEGTIAIGEAVRILRDVADALGAAHAQGVIHRDIKPENIMMLGRSAVVTDFGVAKALTAATGGKDAGLTATGVTAGTPAYMAPEQLAADPSIDQRADLYSLGVVAYELLTGTAPFAGRTPTQLAAAIMTEEPPPLAAKRPDLPPALTALVTRLLAKDPMSRPATAAQVVDAFDALEITSPTVAGQPRRARALVRWRTPILAVAVVLATVAGIYAMRRTAAPAAARGRTRRVLGRWECNVRRGTALQQHERRHRERTFFRRTHRRAQFRARESGRTAGSRACLGVCTQAHQSHAARAGGNVESGGAHRGRRPARRWPNQGPRAAVASEG